MKKTITFCVLLALSNTVQSAATTIEIKTTTVTPTSVTGVTKNDVTSYKPFKFTATLSKSLTSGYKVLIDYGSGLKKMNCVLKICSVNFTPSIASGLSAYKVGLYYKNVLQGNAKGGTFTINAPQKSPIELKIIGQETTISNQMYSINVEIVDIDNVSNYEYLPEIDWGDGGFTRYEYDKNYNHIYKLGGNYTIKATLYENSNYSPVVSYAEKLINVQQQYIHKNEKNYVKVCNNGALAGTDKCSINAKLGKKSTDWGCTLDTNVISRCKSMFPCDTKTNTQLMWEVKTTDNGLRDWQNVYTNNKNDESPINSEGFVLEVNQEGLCGAKDWRLPYSSELKTLVYCSDGVYDNGIDSDKPLKKPVSLLGSFSYVNNTATLGMCIGKNYQTPAINLTYFPNTSIDGFYWSYGVTNNGIVSLIESNTGYMDDRYVDAPSGKVPQLVRLVRTVNLPDTVGNK